MNFNWFVGLGIVSIAIAAQAAPTCTVANFTQNASFAQATIAGAESDTASFQFDNDDGSENGTGDCPSTDTQKCPVKRSLAGGDKVVTSRNEREFTCVWYRFSDGAGMTGWVPTAKLQISKPDANPALSAWAGQWSDKFNKLTVTPKGTALLLEGSSHFGKDEHAHIGGFTATPTPKGNVVKAADAYDSTLDDTSCHVTLTLLQDVLVAGDNGRCGAQPVGFSGVMARQ